MNGLLRASYAMYTIFTCHIHFVLDHHCNLTMIAWLKVNHCQIEQPHMQASYGMIQQYNHSRIVLLDHSLFYGHNIFMNTIAIYLRKPLGNVWQPHGLLETRTNYTYNEGMLGAFMCCCAWNHTLSRAWISHSSHSITQGKSERNSTHADWDSHQFVVPAMITVKSQHALEIRKLICPGQVLSQ